jgi:hypothetical protein
VALAVLAFIAIRSIGVTGSVSASQSPAFGIMRTLVLVTAGLAVAYLAVQYSRTDLPAVVAGCLVATSGGAALVAGATLIGRWPDWLAAFELLSGAALVGGVTAGMLLGHWYLNQPGLKPWALARVTVMALVATACCGLLGLVSYGKLSGAATTGAALGMPFGGSFAFVFYLTWLALVLFTGAVAIGARRCIAIRSIQSATGLYYVGLLTAGVAEFLVRYLMVNAR